MGIKMLQDVQVFLCNTEIRYPYKTSHMSHKDQPLGGLGAFSTSEMSSFSM